MTYQRASDAPPGECGNSTAWSAAVPGRADSQPPATTIIDRLGFSNPLEVS
jgi:hypothetical protein